MFVHAPQFTSPRQLNLVGVLASYGPSHWAASEIEIIHEAVRLYSQARGLPMFNVPFVRASNDLGNGAGGRVIGNENFSIHPNGASATVLLSDNWSSFGANDRQFGKWVVVHEMNHAYLWLRFEERIRYEEINDRAVNAFVNNPAPDSPRFPTSYAERYYGTGTEYLAEGMTGMVWNKQGEPAPTTSPHVYTNNVDHILSADGTTLPTWILDEVPGFMNGY